MDYTREVAARMRTFTTLGWLAMPYDVSLSALYIVESEETGQAGLRERKRQQNKLRILPNRCHNEVSLQLFDR
jgi:hypothetical protein